MEERIAKFGVKYEHADVELLHGQIRGVIIWAPRFCKRRIKAAVAVYAASARVGNGEVASIVVAVPVNVLAVVVVVTPLRGIKTGLISLIGVL